MLDEQITKTVPSNVDLIEIPVRIEPNQYSPTKIIYDVLPKKLRNSTYLPVFQYLKEAEITKDNYIHSDLNVKIKNIIEFDYDNLSNKGNLDFLEEDKEQMQLFLEAFRTNKIKNIDIEIFRKILKKYFKILNDNSSTQVTNKTDFKRLCCLL